MTLDSLPDLDTSGLCLVKTLSTPLTCWPYRNTRHAYCGLMVTPGADRGESDIERAVRGTERVMHDVAGRWLDVTWNARPATARDTRPVPPSRPVARFPNCLRPCLRC